MVESEETQRADERPDEGGSPIGALSDRILEIKRLYPDLAAITVDALFLSFLFHFAQFGVFSFGPVTIDVRLVERRFEQTYPRQEPPFNEVRLLDEGGHRFYRTLGKELAQSGSRRPDELHFLLAFMRTEEGLPARVFGELGIAPEAVRAYARDRAADAASVSVAPAAAGAGPERLYSPEEAAEYLGVHVQTVRVWIRQGKLPARRILGQRALRIRESDLTQALEPLDHDEE